MKYSIVHPHEFTRIKWSGGTSTQLFIHPKNSDYKLQNFDFRLSTASVEVDKSDFTSLPEISRHIMILKGSIEITHNNQVSKLLRPFEPHFFEGGWQTSSIGKCIDFNLMTRNQCTGELNALLLEKNETCSYIGMENCKYLFIYICEGIAEIKFLSENVRIQKGSLFYIETDENVKFSIKSTTASQLVISKIRKT